MTIGHPQIYEKYRVDSGNTLPKLGEVEYSLLTESGNGFAYLKNGKHVMACDATSHESVGFDVEVGKNGPYLPTKWIRANNGDILFDAPNGTIYLNAKNIVLNSNGADPDGNIFLSCCNDVYIKSTDNVTITGTNVTVSASKTATLVGQHTTNIAANFLGLVEVTDIASSITSLEGRFTDLLKLLESI